MFFAESSDFVRDIFLGENREVKKKTYRVIDQVWLLGDMQRHNARFYWRHVVIPRKFARLLPCALAALVRWPAWAYRAALLRSEVNNSL